LLFAWPRRITRCLISGFFEPVYWASNHVWTNSFDPFTTIVPVIVLKSSKRELVFVSVSLFLIMCITVCLFVLILIIRFCKCTAMLPLFGKSFAQHTHTYTHARTEDSYVHTRTHRRQSSTAKVISFD